MSKCALVMHEDCARHDTGWHHPEHQGRLPAIVQALYLDTPELQNYLVQPQVQHADERELERVHSAELLATLRGAHVRAREGNQIVPLDSETMMSPASWDAVLASVGSLLTACQAVLRGEARNGFALARPPGHHATRDRAMGFCLVNNVAIAAHWLRAQGVQHVLIVDWDVHHGNGTQDIFYTDPSVYYLSTHQSPWYPGTGARSERGQGAGAGSTRNVPLPAGTTGAEFRQIFERELAATLAEFTPEFVLVSAGFDCLRGDPLGGLLLEPADLHAVTRSLMNRVQECAAGRIVHALEGGYNPARIGAGVVDVVRALAGLPPKP